MKVRTCVTAKSAIRMECLLVSATLMQPRTTLSQAGLNNRPGAPLFKAGPSRCKKSGRGSGAERNGCNLPMVVSLCVLVSIWKIKQAIAGVNILQSTSGLRPCRPLPAEEGELPGLSPGPLWHQRPFHLVEESLVIRLPHKLAHSPFKELQLIRIRI